MKFTAGKVALLILVLVSGLSASAQQNAIKVTPIRLLGRQLHLGYERALTDKMSVGLSGMTFFPFQFDDGTIANANLNTANTEISSGTLKGYSVTPELRFYPGSKGAMRGFHAEPFVRHYAWTLGTEGEYTDGADVSQVATDLRLSGTGLGVSIGFQGIVGDVFVIDWFIGGGATASRVRVSGAVDGPLEEDVQAYIDDLNASIGAVPGLGNNLIKGDAESFNFKSSFVAIPVLRTGLSIGVAF
ncbi:MAG: DUF3575 domain-containing protein [Bacteroidia bacterium]|nr:DUF3575 domain-containing protein [Bacteroidia bacterium]